MQATPRYNSLNVFLRKQFGEKVYKVSLNGGFSCPNLDGYRSDEGCIYCNPASNMPEKTAGIDIKDQVVTGIANLKKRHGASKVISYFQHYSNTYASKKELMRLYEEAIDNKDVVGLAISTRPDCINEETIEVLSELKKRTFVWLEIGLQSAHNKTLQMLNRHHTVEDFTRAVGLAHEASIMTCAHIILGLPLETKKEMLKTITYLADIKIGGVKIHNLHVLKDTRLEEMYNNGEFNVLTLEEYAGLVVDCLEHLPKEVLIHRFNGHSPRNLTVAPMWSVNKLGTLNAVHNELLKRDSWQGKMVGC